MPVLTKIEEITKIRGLSKDSFGGPLFILEAFFLSERNFLKK